MNVLILSCGTGGGHDSAARAILEEMKKCGHNAEMLNPYTLKSCRLAGIIDKCYIAIARSVPRGFGAIYKIGDLYRRLPFRSPVYYINRLMNSTMKEFLAKNHFDVVVMTHLFGAEILTNMKNHGMQTPKTIFVATDYVCIPFTEETECDAYVIPANDLTEDFINRGLPVEKLHPLGIPVHSSFALAETRVEAKLRLGLDMAKKYILITGGSMGGGKIEKAIEKIQLHFANKSDTELIIICGSNKILYNKINELADAKITVTGHTDDMASYIKASNLFVTKPGGLSSTEAAVCGVPVLHTSPIPGCETHNARYFNERGMSISGEITDDILCAIYNLLNNDDISRSMIDNQKRYINPYAAKDICELVENLAAQIDN